MKLIFILASLLIGIYNLQSQEYLDWEEHSVDEFYEKTDVPTGTLCEDGDEIDYILIPTTIKAGTYQIEITDASDDLYEIKGTDYFIKFRGYYGYAGYSDEGVLDVGSSAWSSTFYEKE